MLEVQPERLLKYSLALGKLDTSITWLLISEGSGTRLKPIHEGFDLDTPLGRQAFERTGTGWPGLLKRIATALPSQGSAQAQSASA